MPKDKKKSENKKKSDSWFLIYLSMLAYSLFAYVALGVLFGLLSLDLLQIQIGCIALICMILYRDIMANRP